MSDFVECPECGAKERDLGDHDWSPDDEDLVVSCGSCGKDYVLSRYVRVTYAASKVREGRS